MLKNCLDAFFLLKFILSAKIRPYIALGREGSRAPYVSRAETANEEGKAGWRRGAIDILVDMLEVASKETGKTDIVYRTNLNFKVVGKYLDFLLRKGLIQVDDARQSRRSYRTTEKGRQFIKLYRETIELIS